jgi:hypothetical protein
LRPKVIAIQKRGGSAAVRKFINVRVNKTINYSEAKIACKTEGQICDRFFAMKINLFSGSEKSAKIVR